MIKQEYVVVIQQNIKDNAFSHNMEAVKAHKDWEGSHDKSRNRIHQENRLTGVQDVDLIVNAKTPARYSRIVLKSHPTKRGPNIKKVVEALASIHLHRQPSETNLYNSVLRALKDIANAREEGSFGLLKIRATIPTREQVAALRIHSSASPSLSTEPCRVSEQLVRKASTRGLLGSVVRPGYILGDAATGVCNNDGFLIRMLEGCIQLSSHPHIINTVNAVAVGHVSTVVHVSTVAVAASLNPVPVGAIISRSINHTGIRYVGVHVVHVTAHPRLRMNEYLSILSYYGYDVPEVDYDNWKTQLETFVSAGFVQKDEEQSALMPLFHMVTNDLPSTTRAPELDDRNAVIVLKADADRWTGVDESGGEGIGREAVGRFLRYLAETKFLAWPTGRGRELPAIGVDVVQAQA
ncbi:hypothetical protein GQX73_g5999 [Xylaria multiplex]|uniref:Thioester reductase (TE) domain-containing protein n=1 Tax=Xylaria multiplex TaxID=323545 RepID=A0A7C8IZV0_9PEZI|nr:hypothetical protein GQX73_g5999 [Xylaria multiplex]